MNAPESEKAPDARTGARRARRARRLLGVGLGAAALAALAAAGSQARGQEDRDAFRPRAFQLYDTQAARARSGEAKEHIAAKRWSEALTELQALIEEHRGEVLGADRPRPLDALRVSQKDVHFGAGSWAVEQLFKLPPAGRELYRERFGRRAEEALERAIASSDRGSLARVAQRWPLTAAAERAWWALGDLEIELGHAGDGLRAWARAAALRVGDPLRVTTTEAHWRALRDELGEDAASGVRSRMDLALELFPVAQDASGSRPAAEASFARGPATGIAATSITSSRFRSGEGAAGWPRPFQLPDSPYAEAGASRLFPQRSGDIVYVNTTRSVHALDAFDGSEIWSLEPHQLNWGTNSSTKQYSKYDKAVDRHERIVTVAVSRGVVVAPVQIPWTFEDSDQYNDLSIIEVIPERRLVALDAATGEPLWNTMPRYDWDGDSGTFAERMTVVGPPTIVGARVLVPMARLRGRIEMHLGCFDLATGEVLWSAPLVTGQRTLNMFGRANIEFSAPPPVVAGDSVIVATQLGLIASIDLFTGETRWDALYDQVSIQAPQYYTAGWMQNRWRNAPPVVVGDTVVAAPFDAKEIFALDAASGATLWSVDQRTLTREIGISSVPNRRKGPSTGLNVLLGADENRILLGGSSVAAVQLPGGIRAGGPFERAWAWPFDGIIRTDSGYPTVDARSVYIPYANGVVVVDRQNGRTREELTGSVGSGHLLVADGMLFVTNGKHVDARFEWIAMVERARTAVRRDDASTSDLDMLVRLLLERSESLLDRGTDVPRALTLTREAEQALNDFTTRPAAGVSERDGAGFAASSTRLQRHRALMLRARGERLRGDGDAARRAIKAALALEVPDEAQLEALLTLHEIERRRSPADRARVLDRLLERHSQYEIEVEAAVLDGRWSPSVALATVLDATRGKQTTSTRLINETLWIDPWVDPIVPRSAALSGTSAGDPDAPRRRAATVSVGLFALLSQIEMARVMPDARESVEGELIGLHAILREAPAEPLFGAVSGEWASARIRALRALSPDAPAIARFDRAADSMLEEARRAASTHGSTTELERIPELFPGSPAARSAAEARIEFALANGSPEEVAAIVVEALSPDWHPARSTERETSLLLQLAMALGEAGNEELRAGIARNLARYRPDDTHEVAGVGAVTLTTLADRWAVAPRLPRTDRATFDNRVVAQKSISGDFVPVARGPVLVDPATGPGGATQEILLVSAKNTLAALTTGRSGAPLWTRPSSFGVSYRDRHRRVHLGPTTVVTAERKRVVCRDVLTGDELWDFRQDRRSIASMSVADGVAVIVTERSDTQEPAEVYGIDIALGIELWRLGSIGGRYHTVVKVGDGRLVLLPVRFEMAGVHDLYTGHPVARIETGRINSREALSAWIDRGRLVRAHIEAGQRRDATNLIVAYDLDDGEEAWRIDLDNHAGEVQNLLGLIEMPASADRRETIRLAMLERVDANRPPGGLRRDAMGLYRINERLGALDRSPIATLNPSTYLVGIDIRRRIVVDGPLLMAVTAGRDEDPAVITAIDPNTGVVWKEMAARRIKAQGMERYSTPVIGDGVVAMIVQESFGRGNASTAEKKLMFLDAVSGRHVETRPLESGNKTGRWRNLAAVDGTLVVMGGQRMEVME
ncbi:MAG: PQQ-binding-like beta-propeller repeat protein [Planctomycetota bacterium]